jgi:RNA polymerase sigma factor (sigma-70 family)
MHSAPSGTFGNLRGQTEIENEIAQLHQQHSAGLLRYAGMIADTQETACDAVQEVFLRYFVERSHGREISNPRAWFHQVLRNYLSDRMNAAATRLEILADNLERHADEFSDPETQLKRSQMADELAAVMSSRELECLELRTAGLSYAEIGIALELRIGTVGALLNRAYEKIRKRSEGDWSLGRDLVCAMFQRAKETGCTSN